MNNIRRATISVILGFSLSISLFAQNGPDGVRAGMFAAYAQQAKKAFNDYLNSFDDILTVAADIYGIYMEVDEAMKNVKVVKGIVVRQPANVLAVAFSQSKNNIYTDIIENGLKLAADIEQILPLKKDQDKNAKMTQYERLKVMDNIRLNLRTLNRKLRILSRLIHYTTIMDSWYDLKGTGKEYQPRKMGSITKDCLRTWMKHAKGIKY